MANLSVLVKGDVINNCWMIIIYDDVLNYLLKLQRLLEV